MRAPFWQTDLRESAPCPWKILLFSIFGKRISKSPPPWPQKYPVYLSKALFRPLGQCLRMALIVTIRPHCTSQPSGSKFGQWTSDNRVSPKSFQFYHFLSNSCSCPRKTLFWIEIPLYFTSSQPESLAVVIVSGMLNRDISNRAWAPIRSRT